MDTNNTRLKVAPGTVTFYMVGKVEKIIAGKFIKLSDASWIPVSGRFMQCIKNGCIDEVEPVGDCFVNIESAVDFFPWKHDLPRDQK